MGDLQYRLWAQLLEISYYQQLERYRLVWCCTFWMQSRQQCQQMAADQLHQQLQESQVLSLGVRRRPLANDQTCCYPLPNQRGPSHGRERHGAEAGGGLVLHARPAPRHRNDALKPLLPECCSPPAGVASSPCTSCRSALEGV